MKRVTHPGPVRYMFATFAQGLVDHAVFTRQGGGSLGSFAGLNVGHTVGDNPLHVEANHRAIYAALGTRVERVVTARQVHGDRVHCVSAEDGGRVIPDTDALMSTIPGMMLMLRFADCVPVFLAASHPPVVALVHAGWQGTLKRIAAKTAQMMCTQYGCRAEDLVAGLGPSIGPCCFEVGPEVLEPLRATYGDRANEFLSTSGPEGRAHLDLWRLNAAQLQDLGVQQIEVAGVCTCCHRDEFYSHRAEHGRTGRFAALIGLPGLD